jgi:thioredoxin-related protein
MNRYGSHYLLPFLALLGIATATQAAREGALEAGMVVPGHEDKPAWFKSSFLDIREDVQESVDSGRRVMLYFYQDGCPYCKKLLEDNFGQAEISRLTQRYFDVIAINMWGDREVVDFQGRDTTEKAFSVGLKVMFTPTLLLLDERGEVVLRINGYFPPHRFRAALEYVGTHQESAGGFRGFLARQDPEPASGRLHREPGYLQPPYRLAEQLRASAKPLLVLFEQRQCAACDELHQDILRRPESRALLGAFDVVLLDMWSQAPLQTPDGRELSAAGWARELNILYAPSQVFFDTEGREVFRSEAYLKAFHIQSVMDYVASGAYRSQPEFQRYIEARADALRAKGIQVNLME